LQKYYRQSVFSLPLPDSNFRVRHFLRATRSRRFPVNEARQSQTPRRTGDTVARECTAAGSRITLHDEASFSNVEMSDTLHPAPFTRNRVYAISEIVIFLLSSIMCRKLSPREAYRYNTYFKKITVFSSLLYDYGAAYDNVPRFGNHHHHCEIVSLRRFHFRVKNISFPFNLL